MATPLHLSRFSPPFRFLAECLGRLADPDSDRARVVDGERWAGLDWTLVGELAARHRVEAALARVLEEAGWREIPDGLRAALKSSGRREAVRALVQTAESERVAVEMHRRDIRFFILKGIPLGHLLFASAAVRQSKDIDLLVDAADMDRAIACLEDLGFDQLERERELARTPRQREAFMRMRSDLGFLNPATKALVELHWRPAAPELFPFDMEAAWRSREIVRPNKAEMPILPPASQFLYLACHGAGHAWFRLKWLLDIAAMLNRMSAADLAAIWADSKRQRLDAVVGSATVLAAALLGARIEPALLEEMAANPRARRLVDLSEKALKRPHPKEYSLLMLINRLRLKPGLNYLGGVARGSMYCPQDWQDVPLPDSLFPLYVFIRPFAWARRRLSS